MQSPNVKFLFAHPAHFLALGFGAGLSPRAPGTLGTLVAVPLFWGCLYLGGPGVAAIAGAALFAIGIWAATVTGRALGVSDHGGIVIDEIAAFLLVLACTPQGWVWLGLAFVVFRLFDITKPWPIGLADRNIKGGFGVMFDDLLAAGYSILSLMILQAVWERVSK